jgi:hypothetical protein
MYPYTAIRRLPDSGTPSLLAMSSHIIIVPAQKVLLGVLNPLRWIPFAEVNVTERCPSGT